MPNSIVTPSYSQRLMQAGHSRGQFRHLETCCDQAVIHELKSIGDLAGKAEVLFHQQEVMPRCFRVCSALPVRCTITGASPSVGSSTGMPCGGNDWWRRQVFLDAERSEDAPLLRDIADPGGAL